eukprot:8003818-Alexandrium_andersonii.AAC.1
MAPGIGPSRMMEARFSSCATWLMSPIQGRPPSMATRAPQLTPELHGNEAYPEQAFAHLKLMHWWRAETGEAGSSRSPCDGAPCLRDPRRSGSRRSSPR